MRYAVIECICGRYLVMDLKFGFKKCPYCGYVNKSETARIIKSFKKPKQASELARFLNSGKSKFKPLA